MFFIVFLELYGQMYALGARVGKFHPLIVKFLNKDITKAWNPSYASI